MVRKHIRDGLEPNNPGLIMDVFNLNDENFLLYCAKAYDRPHAIFSELQQDLKRLKYLKRLFKRYLITRNLKDRLILNHLIVLFNVFGNEAATRILFFKIGEECYPVLKTFLILIDRLPKSIDGINGKIINTDIIPVDLVVADILKKI